MDFPYNYYSMSLKHIKYHAVEKILINHFVFLYHNLTYAAFIFKVYQTLCQVYSDIWEIKRRNVLAIRKYSLSISSNMMSFFHSGIYVHHVEKIIKKIALLFDATRYCRWKTNRGREVTGKKRLTCVEIKSCWWEQNMGVSLSTHVN